MTIVCSRHMLAAQLSMLGQAPPDGGMQLGGTPDGAFGYIVWFAGRELMLGTNGKLTCAQAYSRSRSSTSLGDAHKLDKLGCKELVMDGH